MAVCPPVSQAAQNLSSRGSVPLRRFSLVVLLVSEVAAMSTWFATTASLSSIRAQFSLSAFHEALLTSSVQAGFVAGTLLSALLTLPDRFDLRRLFSAGAVTAAWRDRHPLLRADFGFGAAVALSTGACMAAVYPVGMKLAATWAAGDLGLLVGLLVAALTVGSAFPHLVAAGGGLDWRWPIAVAAASSLLAGGLIRLAAVGPNLSAAPPFRLENALHAWRNRRVRLANLGYLGHMWELYAMWAWIGAFFAASFRDRYGAFSPVNAELAAFAVVSAGAFGAVGGGWAADRFGRATVTIVAMTVSGSCAACIGVLFGGPAWPLIAVGLVWGVAVIADSASSLPPSPNSAIRPWSERCCSADLHRISADPSQHSAHTGCGQLGRLALRVRVPGCRPVPGHHRHGPPASGGDGSLISRTLRADEAAATGGAFMSPMPERRSAARFSHRQAEASPNRIPASRRDRCRSE